MLLETRTLPFSAVRQRRSDFFEVLLILFVCFSVCPFWLFLRQSRPFSVCRTVFQGGFLYIMSDNKRIGLYISDELLDLCDRNIGRDDSRSRSEFVCNAIEFYIASLDKEMVEGFLSPALEAVISARVKDT